MARGQVSAEYLIILAVSLAAIAIAASALFSFSSQYRDNMAQSRADSVARQIQGAAQEACIFGEGNSRAVSGLPANFTIEPDPVDPHAASVRVDGKAAGIKTSCSISAQQVSYSSQLQISYDNGKLDFS